MRRNPASSIRGTALAELADQVSLELRNHGKHVEQQSPDGIGRVIPAPAETERDAPAREFIRNLASVPQRPGEAVKLRHDERVAASHRSERLPQARPGAVRAGHSMVDVDVLIVNTQTQ
jgi:hypothetical protein